MSIDGSGSDIKSAMSLNIQKDSSLLLKMTPNKAICHLERSERSQNEPN